MLLFLSAALSLQAQKLTPVRITELNKTYIEAKPWEELFLHTDRQKLIAGEDIWFSIYSVDRGTGKLSALSSIAYVELISPWNIPLIQKRFELSGGRGEGSFLLPDTLSSGTYTIRAYTNWMKNFLPVNCFRKEISVFNPFRNNGYRRKVELPDTSGKTLDVRFYPEGGTFLNGVENKIIVKCVNRFGQGTPVSGIVTDDSGSQLVTFKSDESGLGTILIIPEKGRTYSLKTGNASFRLPVADNDGLTVMAEDITGGAIELRVSAAGSYVLPSSRKYYFVIESGGNISSISEFKISDQFTKISVPQSKLKSGVNQLTLLSEDGVVMFERLVYSSGKPLKVILSDRDTVFGKRQKITLDPRLFGDIPGGTTHLSLTVTRESIASETGIEEYMLFGTEFGRFPWMDSGRSLENVDPDQIDACLICAGSNWIDWNKIINGEKFNPVFKPEKEGHFLDVSVRYREPEHVDSVDYLYMAIQGKYAEFKYARRDTAGNYEFVLPIDNTQRNLIIQPAIASSNMILEVKPSFLWDSPHTITFKDAVSEQQLAEFTGLSFNYQASRIYSTIYRKERPVQSNVNIKKPRFYGIPEIEIRMDDYIKLPVMQEVFFELIPGVSLRTRKTGYEMRIINPFSSLYYEEEPLVMIDGMILNDINILANFDPELVERIEVVKTPYLIGDLVLNGIVNIVTRAGTYSNVVIPEYAAQLPYTVIDNAPMFVAPDYSDQKLKESRIPDLRNTVLWDPEIILSPEKMNTIEFWTTDQAGRYTIDIEGVSESGEKISLRKSFSVK